MPPVRVLLTGFGPFGEVVDNPSARVAWRLAAEGVTGCDIRTHVFPVSYEQVAVELPRLISQGGFELLLMLGVAQRSDAIRLERLARNHIGSTADHVGRRPTDARVIEGAPEFHETGVPADDIAESLRRDGLPVVLSDDAGTYLCNFAYYLALHHLSDGAPCLFVHIPADEHTLSEPDGPDGLQSLPFAETLKTVRAVLHSLLPG